MRVYEGNPVLVDECQACWSASIKNGVVWYSEDSCSMGVSVEHFLATFGLYEFIIGQSEESLWLVKDEDDPLSPLEKDALLIWQGTYGYPELTIHFWYHQMGILWFDLGGTTIVGAAKDAGVLEKLQG